MILKIHNECFQMEKEMIFINDNLCIHTSLNDIIREVRAFGDAPWLMNAGWI